MNNVLDAKTGVKDTLPTLATITCMSTAIGLVVAFAQDFHKRFPKISYRTFLTFNCLLSFAIANFGLTTIIAWSTPVLMFLYPLAIALTFAGHYLPFFSLGMGWLTFEIAGYLLGLGIHLYKSKASSRAVELAD